MDTSQTPTSLAGHASPASFPINAPTQKADTSSELLAANIEILATPETANSIRAHLKDMGFSNVRTVNQVESLAAQISEQSIDLILIGCEQLESDIVNSVIAECKQEPRIPVLAITRPQDTQGKKLSLASGVEDFVCQDADAFELAARIKNTLRARIATTQLNRYSAQFQSDSLIDPLTNVANRRAFDFELSRKMIAWQRERQPLALIMIDIDFFKQVNDQYGHQAGDAVLAQVATEINDAVREMDLVCRFGGEEFAAIVPIKRSEESTQTAERIRQRVESKIFRASEHELKITVSVGVAEVMKGDDQELIVKRADTALYESKQNGRNQVTVHDGARCVAVSSLDETNTTQVRRRQETPLERSINDQAFNISASHILIASDDEKISRQLCQALNEKGFRNVLHESNRELVMDYFDKDAPAMLMLTINSSDSKYLRTLAQVRENSRLNDIPVIAITPEFDLEVKSKSLEFGANEFLVEPFSDSEIITRVTNTLLASAHSKFMAGYTMKLEQEVKVRTSELIASRREAIQCLARVAELRDDRSGRHIVRVGKYAALIAEELGFTDSQVIEMEHAAQLHDVGKIDVPDTILTKQDELTAEEFDIVKAHCGQGGQIIRDDNLTDETAHPADCFLLDACNSNVMRMAALVAESHHERWDGSGYPKGLRGDNIPIEGRIAAVCDVFDVISNPKSYRLAFDLESCFQIILDGSGTQFDPEIVRAFFKCKADVVQIHQDFSSSEFES